MKYLLDTCALIWLGMGGGALGPAARKRISVAAQLCYSSISVWEIARLKGEGKLRIPVAPDVFMSDLVEAYGLTSLPPTDSIMLRAAQLPSHHRDPADRIIIATALVHGLAVVTGDEKFPQYGVRTIV